MVNRNHRLRLQVVVNHLVADFVGDEVEVVPCYQQADHCRRRAGVEHLVVQDQEDLRCYCCRIESIRLICVGGAFTVRIGVSQVTGLWIDLLVK